MLWFALALLAPLLWAAGNLIDGDLVTHRIRNPLVILGVTGLFCGLPAVYIFLTGGFTAPSWPFILLGLVAGVVSLWTYYPYFRALKTASPSEAVLLWNMSPVLIVISAHFLLGERLNPIKYVAIGLLILSTIVIESAHVNHKRLIGKMQAVKWMMLASVGTAVQALMEKRLYQSVSPTTGLFLISLGGFVFGAMLFFSQRERHTVIRAFASSGGILFANEILDVSAAVVLSLAVSLGPVSAVMALEGVQSLFIIVLAWIASRLFTRKQFQTVKSPPVHRLLLAALLTVVGMALVG